MTTIGAASDGGPVIDANRLGLFVSDQFLDGANFAALFQWATFPWKTQWWDADGFAFHVEAFDIDFFFFDFYNAASGLAEAAGGSECAGGAREDDRGGQREQSQQRDATELNGSVHLKFLFQFCAVCVRG